MKRKKTPEQKRQIQQNRENNAIVNHSVKILSNYQDFKRFNAINNFFSNLVIRLDTSGDIILPTEKFAITLKSTSTLKALEQQLVPFLFLMNYTATQNIIDEKIEQTLFFINKFAYNELKKDAEKDLTVFDMLTIIDMLCVQGILKILDV